LEYGSNGKRSCPGQSSPTEYHHVQVALKQWQLWSLSVLVALMPLSFSTDQHIKVLPTALLFLVGLGLLAGDPRTRRSYRTG
jgi:O-antigen ligase